ncbi:MAG: hypothetical protein COU26_04335 [Candidatus Levybacteria bacterium CG10_big_fil_rev_8_21_14_0_10_36_30]|nr:MAG: hypothetical protein COU26_04335 [Candidatus Levybacteria bacterium CG10_big_fil_rev_8_21_14_0_10_36_30]
MNVKISIITPTYNQEKFLKQCIESVLTQTYKNWEMIIIDDNSNNYSFKIVKDYAKRDNRIKYLKHAKRWGIEKLKNTYNQGLKIAKGEYIAILEGDDYWPKDKLEKQLIAFKNKDVVLSFGDAIVTTKNSHPFQIIDYRLYNKNLLENKPSGSIINLFFDLNFYLETATVLIRKSTLVRIGGFQSDKSYPFVDIPTWLVISLQGEFKYLNTILGYYRKHESSSWFNNAANTDAMLRTELSNLLTSFIKKNKKILEKKMIEIPSYNKLNEALREKRQRKIFSIMLHKVVFGNKRDMKESGVNIIFNSQNKLAHKFLAIFLILTIPIHGFLISLNFKFQQLRYVFVRIWGGLFE